MALAILKAFNTHMWLAMAEILGSANSEHGMITVSTDTFLSDYTNQD